MLLSGSSQTIAEDEILEVELQPLIIEASRFDLSTDESLRGVTVISSQELEERKPSSVMEALQYVPGLNIRQNGGRGSTSVVSLRGLAGEQTLIMINGVPIRNPASTSQINLDFLPVGDIQQIEVMRGAQSVQFGADAVGGVINIVTQDAPSDPLRVTQDITVGSRDFWQTQTSIGGSYNGWTYLGYFSYEETNGFSRQAPRYAEADDFESAHTSLQLGREISEIGHLEVIYRLRETQSDYDANSSDDPTSFSNEVSNFINVRGNFQILENLTSRPEFGWSNLDVDYHDSSGLESDTYNFDWETAYTPMDATTLISGLEYEYTKAASINEFSEETDLISFYALARQRFSDAVTLEAGIRQDDYDSFGSVTTYQVAAQWDIELTKTSVFGSYGTSFRAPRVADQLSTFDNSTIPNPDLDPEAGEGFDLGFEQSLLDGMLKGGATFYYIEVEDQITYENIGSYGQFVNLDSVRSQGVEAFLDVKIWDGLELHLNYTYTDAEDQSDNTPLSRIPSHQYSGILNYRFPEDRANVNFRGLYISQQPDKNINSEDIENEKYTVFDISAEINVSENFSIYGSIENLFDADYATIMNYPAQKRTFFMGARYTFQ